VPVNSGRVSVVVPTRNRPEHAAACATSILATTGFLELIVIDQSDDRATEEALSKIRDSRLLYVRTATRGVSSGRNHGIELSAGEIVAFTDDDCRVSKDWISTIAGIFASDPEVVMVCGSVSVPAEMLVVGWAENFSPQRREWQGCFPPFGQWGISANLSLRRSLLKQVGQFDPFLGAGAPLRSGGEPDLLFRVLRAGLKVVNAPEVVVEHVGMRSLGHETEHLIEGYGVGTGAAFFKHVRLGDVSALRVYLRFFAANVGRLFTRFVSRKRPLGGRFLWGFLVGTIASLRFRIDRQRREYAPRRGLLMSLSEERPVIVVRQPDVRRDSHR
jgi:glycosyltransferase involved in cell wall biosynthesis